MSDATDVRLAAAADAADVGRVLAGGFSDDPVFTWLFPERDRVPKLDAFFGFLATETLVPLGATYLAGSDACAAWTPPDPAPWSDEVGARFAASVLPVCSPDDLARMRVLDETMSAAHPRESHWYLGLIGTVPVARSRGLGSRLLAHTLAIVDDAALPAYLEATSERNAALYARFGFVRTGEIEIPDGGPTLIAMWREPGARTTPSAAAG
jgi:GNAT superfamily N-acetyltransferase